LSHLKAGQIFEVASYQDPCFLEASGDLVDQASTLRRKFGNTTKGVRIQKAGGVGRFTPRSTSHLCKSAIRVASKLFQPHG